MVLEPMERFENPAWADKALNAGWPTITSSEHGLPIASLKGKKRSFVELGCGHYGCVLETDRRGVVLKITTDPTEVSFVHVLLRMLPKDPPGGLVRYYDVKRLPGSFRGRPIFAIWREEAFNVGESFSSPPFEGYKEQARNRFRHRLMEFMQLATVARDYLKKSSDPWALLAKASDAESRAHDWVVFGRRLSMYGGKDAFREGAGEDVGVIVPSYIRGVEYKLAAHLRGCQVSAEMMANEPEGYLIGSALEQLLDRGVLLADVHAGNVGEAFLRPDYDESEQPLVITDPGHAVFLEKELQEEANAFLAAAEAPEAARLEGRAEADKILARAGLRRGNPVCPDCGGLR